MTMPLKDTNDDPQKPVQYANGFRAAEQVAQGHLEEGTELGAVQIHNHVIATIARQAALGVKGVVEMSGTFVDGLAGMLGRNPADRGIRVDLEDQSIALELHVVLEFGVRIPQVAWQIQNEVRQAVEQMTGKTVKAVNVIIQSLRFPDESKPGAQEGGRA